MSDADFILSTRMWASLLEHVTEKQRPMGWTAQNSVVRPHKHDSKLYFRMTLHNKTLQSKLGMLSRT